MKAITNSELSIIRRAEWVVGLFSDMRAARAAVKSGALFPGSGLIRFYGHATHRRVLAIIGMKPTKQKRPTSTNFIAAIELSKTFWRK
jgi:hypothetical protein